MKKKIASLSMLLCLLAVFFVVPVHAENTYIRNIRTYSGYKSAASLTYSATACQFHYNSDTSLTGGIYSPVLITVRFTNNGSNDVKIANSYVDLTFTNTAEVQRFDCYTSDLMVQVAGTAGQHTPRYNIIGGDGFSYNGHIIVPHNSSIYLVFEVDIAGNLNTSNGQPEGPGLDAVFVGVADSDVQTGEFVSGIIPRQLDELDTLVTNIYTSQAAATSQLQNMYSDVHTLLTDIKNQIRFTGTYVPPSISSYSSAVYAERNITDPNLIEFSVRRTVYPSFVLYEDFELNGNSYVSNGYKRYVINYLVIFNLRKAISAFNLQINQLITTNSNINPYIVNWDSNFAGTVFVLNNGVYVYGNGTDDDRYVYPAGRNFVNIQLYLDVPITTNINLVDLSSLTGSIHSFSSAQTYTGYYPYSTEQGLADIYNEITSPSQQNTDTINNSNNAGTMSDQIHDQEEQWYRENDTAMENVGLSNYRYTQNQQNGIVGAVLQFEQMWLALGDWTLVYIFTLMLSLAIFILRHEPTTRMKQAREERSAFYAEAGRYYRESARPSNEFVQRVRKFNGK